MKAMRPFAVAGLLCALLGLARMAAFVAGDPLAGYANNYDFIRLEACLGLWPDVAPAQRVAASPEAPLPRYAVGERRPETCQPGSGMVFAAAALGVHRLVAPSETTLSLRWVGFAAFGAAACVVALMAFLLRAHPVAAFVHGVTVLAVMADPLLTLYFNSLYAETATILGTWLLVGLLVAAALRQRFSVPLAVGACAAVLLVGLSKEQFFLLPAVLLGAYAMMAGRAVARSRAFIACAAVALLPAVLFVAPLSDTPRPYPAHRIDTYLGALPAVSEDPPATLRNLGLPGRCVALVGGTWHRLRGEELEATCPEVLALSHFAFVPLALREPGTFARAFAALGVQSQNAFSGLVGVVAGREYGTLQDLAAWRRSPWTPLFQQAPPLAFAGLVVAGVAASLVLALFAGLRRAPASMVGTYPALLGLTIAYTAATALVGDGFADAAKHVNLAAIALTAGLVAAAALLVPAIARAVLFDRALVVTVLAAVVTGLAAGAATWSGMRELPLAFGVIDVPEGRLSRDAPVLRGWALDPQGVERIEIVVGDARVAARHGVEKAGLERVYPSLPQAGRGGFEATLDAATLQPDAPVKVIVVNARGVRTEIDRRRVAP